MKINWCKTLQVAYHIVFAGGMFSGGEYYLTEIRKIERSIVHQVDRVEGLVQDTVATSHQVIDSVKTSTNKVAAAVSHTSKQVKSIEKSINKVKSICSTSIFGG